VREVGGEILYHENRLERGAKNERPNGPPRFSIHGLKGRPVCPAGRPAEPARHCVRLNRKPDKSSPPSPAPLPANAKSDGRGKRGGKNP